MINILFFLSKLTTGDGTGGTVDIPKITAAGALSSILGITYFAAAMVAVIAIIISGYTFTTSAYDPAKAAQAKNAILYSVTGLVFVIIAFAITSFVINNIK